LLKDLCLSSSNEGLNLSAVRRISDENGEFTSKTLLSEFLDNVELIPELLLI
jgi:hypothetical protein